MKHGSSRRHDQGRVGRWLKGLVSHMLVLATLVLAWWLLLRALDVDPNIVPPPEAVGVALLEQMQSDQFWVNFFVTARSAVYGCLLGSGLALILGVLLTQSEILSRSIMPLMVALQSTPKLALAPLLVVWLGFGSTSKLVMAALICFFPMLINVVQGMQSATKEQMEMMKSSGAGRLQTARYLLLPGTMPFVFAALEVCVTLGVVGAVIAEYVGSSAGLGYQLLIYQQQNRIAEMFAMMIALATLGIAQYAVVHLIGQRMLFWARPSQQ